jgi:diguanylate cyclase (GGDEF)-like protein/PAS domain S-box-containing protein
MRLAFTMIRQSPLALTYAVVATLAVTLTRFQGTFALLWAASSILIAALAHLPRRQWPHALICCGMASFLVTGLWGHSWVAAPYMTIVNLTEAFVGAWLMRRNRMSGAALQSLGWLTGFVVAVGIAAPLSATILAAGWLALEGKPIFPDAIKFFYAHSLGNLTFTPLALLVMGDRARRSTRQALSRWPKDSGFLFLLFLVVTVISFAQESVTLLFLPILPIVLIAFRTGREGAALAIAVLALVALGFSAAGKGPAQGTGLSVGFQVIFFQFYLATIVLTILPVAADLQHRKRLHRRIRDSEDRYRLLAENSTDIILKLEVYGRIRYVSPAIRQFGYAPEELIGRNCTVLVDPANLPETTKGHIRTIELAGATNRFEWLIVAKDGTRHWCETSSRMIADESGRFDCMVSIVRCVDERKLHEARLADAAMTDPLTGLPNRRAFCEKAQDVIRQLAPEKSCPIALFDIDHFKQVNDGYGHDAGDEALRIFAKVAAQSVRPIDMVARIGGEEFAAIFPDSTVEQALVVCERLRQAIARTPIHVNGRVIRVTVSGGVATLGPGGIDQALKQADCALYKAKDGGRDQLALAA